MATEPKRDKSTSPSRDKREGDTGTPRPASPPPKKAQPMPQRAERQGTRKVHSKELDAAGQRARTERREAAQREKRAQREEARQNRKPKGWAGRRAARSARGG